MASIKHQYGQYMTPKEIASFMFSLSSANENSRILEPSCGDGIFLEVFKENSCLNYIAYEIDKNIITESANVVNSSFVSSNLSEQFDLIIGNPPYIRWKNLEQELKDELSTNILWNKYCNSLCDYSNIFIIKSIELLKDGGELIFITPEYWLNTTHSLKMRNYMMQNGFFEEIYHFNETPIFDKVTTSTIVFKYRKSNTLAPKNIKVAKYYSRKKPTAKTLDNIKSWKEQEGINFIQAPQFEVDKNWILASKETIDKLKIFERQCVRLSQKIDFFTIGDVCDIGNGMVSGLDKAFQVEETKNLTKEEIKHSIEVVKAKSLHPYYYTDTTKYIFINEHISEDDFKTKYPNYYTHLVPYLEQLKSRYQYNRDIKYWEWVFLRNYNLFSQNTPKIFVPCKERVSNKNYFRFSYADENVFPTQDVTAIYKKEGVEENLLYILALLNSKYVFEWLKCNGIVKGSIVEFSEKPIANIPFRKIDFNNQNEVLIHNQIVFIVENYLKTKNKNLLEELDEIISNLFTENGDSYVCELWGA